METQQDALKALNQAWPHIIHECRQVLGSELHYQAMIYHCFRVYGKVPISQLGMNVKQYITDPVTPLFQGLNLKRHVEYQGGFETIPDVVIFKPEIKRDWRRRNRENTLVKMLMAIEIKASERDGGRLAKGEIIKDILKLAAHHKEVRNRGGDMLAVMMVVDTAHDPQERITSYSLNESIAEAKRNQVLFYYLSQESEISPNDG